MTGKKSKKTSGRTTRAPREQSLGAGLLCIVDELESIDALLQTVPDLEQATRLADAALAPESGTCADALARWAKDAFAVDLDAGYGGRGGSGEESGSSEPDLSDLPNAASTVIDMARWRLRRVAKLLKLAARQASHETRGRGGE